MHMQLQMLNKNILPTRRKKERQIYCSYYTDPCVAGDLLALDKQNREETCSPAEIDQQLLEGIFLQPHHFDSRT